MLRCNGRTEPRAAGRARPETSQPLLPPHKSQLLCLVSLLMKSDDDKPVRGRMLRKLLEVEAEKSI